MVSGISLILGLGARMSDPFVVFWALGKRLMATLIITDFEQEGISAMADEVPPKDRRQMLPISVGFYFYVTVWAQPPTPPPQPPPHWVVYASTTCRPVQETPQAAGLHVA